MRRAAARTEDCRPLDNILAHGVLFRGGAEERATLKAITGIVGELAETAAAPPDPQLTQSDALIRDAGAYADFFAAATADVPAAGEWLQ